MQRFMGFIQRLLKKTAIVSAAFLRRLCGEPQAVCPLGRHCTALHMHMHMHSLTHSLTHAGHRFGCVGARWC